MKAPESTRSHQGTTGADRHVMSINVADMPHIMSVLTDLYANKALAVQREYSTNAWDSHVEAGNTDPILVTLPTRLDPRFIVQDFGLGMTEEQIIDEFSHYGYSTKRESNDVNGQLGLGCKSALSYTGQFTLECVKDSRKILVLVARDASGTGSVEVISNVETDEPNGVTVTVPVSDWHDFNNNARRFYGHWKPGTVLIDGEPPKEHINASQGNEDVKVIVLDEGVYLTNQFSNDLVVMGNVAYPVEPKHNIRGNRKYAAVINVDIGSVQFTPSREALMYTPETLETLAVARKWITESLRTLAEKAVAAAQTPSAAWGLWQDWKEVLPERSHVQWKGQDIPRGGSVRGFMWALERTWEDTNRPARENNMDLSQLRRKNYLTVTGCERSMRGVHGSIKEDARRWIVHNDPDKNIDYVFFVHAIDDWFVGGLNTCTIQDLKDTRTKTVRAAQKREKQRYEVWNHGMVEDLPQHNQCVMIFANDRKKFGGNLSRLNELVKSEGSIMVVVRTNQVEKFKRENKYAILLRDYLEQAHRRMFLGMDPIEALWTVTNYIHDIDIMSSVDPDTIDDPELSNWVRESARHRKNRTVHGYYDALMNAARNICPGLGLTPPASVRLKEAKDFVKEIGKRYPLLDRGYSSSSNAPHYVEYVNALYAVKYKKNTNSNQTNNQKDAA